MASSLNFPSFNFKNKCVVIFGLGSYKYGSGISAAKFFIQHGAKVLITDKKNREDLLRAVREVENFGKKYKNLPNFVLGQHREADFRNADIVVRNPGVPADHQLLQLARQYGAQIHTDVSLFMKILGYPHLNPPPHGGGGEEGVKVIGITGTRGKSTTSALIAEILKKAGKKVFLGGNLGYSPLNFINETMKQGSTEAQKQRSKETIYVVLELSSWLVESLNEWKISPDYAVITNIYPDHLNTYKTMKDYIKAKAVIFKYQKPNDILILNKDNRITYRFAKLAKSRVSWFSAVNLAPLSRFRLDYLPGKHNLENIAASLEVVRALGISQKQAWQAINKFKGLWGRLQFVRNLHGVKFYNDTTATSPEATMQALHTLGKKRLQAIVKISRRETSYRQDLPKGDNLKPKKIILIAGGMDKNLDYKELAREIPTHVKALILFKGTASDKILQELKINSSISLRAGNHGLRNKLMNHNSLFIIHNSVSNMHQAVRLAIELAKRGDVILLSPAAASFNMFRNEVDRGEQFIRIVSKLKCSSLRN